MKNFNGYVILALLALSVLYVVAVPAVRGQQGGLAYMGSEYCGQCHVDKYNSWIRSGHASTLLTADEARERGYPLPEGVQWNDVLFAIGGFKWRILYINSSGYLITWHYENGSRVPGLNQWNIMTKRWADYLPGEEVPFTCAVCHTTGYTPGATTKSRPGILGSWAINGVACERCHGPGGGADEVIGPHKGTGTPLSTLKDPIVCAWCHVRASYEDIIKLQQYMSLSEVPEDLLKKITNIDAKNGLILSHEQFEEWYNSPHAKAGVTCQTCHDPHASAGEEGIKTQCRQCHVFQAAIYEYSTMAKLGVECTDCHMPPIAKSAEGRADIFFGDVRSHLFRINTSADAVLTYIGDDGREYANPYIPLGYACGQPGCHGASGFIEGTLEPILSNRAWDTRRAAEVVAGIQSHTQERLEELKSAISEAEGLLQKLRDAGVQQEYIDLVSSVLTDAKTIARAVEADGTLGVHNPDVDAWIDKAIAAVRSAEVLASIAISLNNVSSQINEVLPRIAELESKASEISVIASRLNETISRVSSLSTDVNELNKRIEGLEGNLTEIGRINEAITQAEESRSTARSSLFIGVMALVIAIIAVGVAVAKR